MTKIIVDSATEAQLSDARLTMELCDAHGRVLGHFVPILDSKDMSKDPQISEEELDRRQRTGGGRPLSGILADLEKRK
jgi:hypothetical protein